MSSIVIDRHPCDAKPRLAALTRTKTRITISRRCCAKPTTPFVFLCGGALSFGQHAQRARRVCLGTRCWSCCAGGFSRLVDMGCRARERHRGATSNEKSVQGTHLFGASLQSLPAEVANGTWLDRPLCTVHAHLHSIAAGKLRRALIVCGASQVAVGLSRGDRKTSASFEPRGAHQGTWFMIDDLHNSAPHDFVSRALHPVPQLYTIGGRPLSLVGR